MDYPKKEFEERRDHVRYPSDLPIKIEAEETPLGPLHVLIDVSFGGISFRSSHKLREGEIIWMRIPSDEPVFEGRGQVVWSKKMGASYQTGVKFINLDKASLDSLMKFLKYVKVNKAS